MLRAEKQILLIGWDFDTRICLDYDARGRRSGRTRRFSVLAAEAPAGAADPHSQMGPRRDQAAGTRNDRASPRALGGQQPDPLQARRSTCRRRQPPSQDRGDRRPARLLRRHRHDRRPLGHARASRRRRAPAGGRPPRRRYDPWHDATMAVDGKVAAALGEHARERWERPAASRSSRPPPQATPGRTNSSRIPRRRHRHRADARRV